MVASRKTEAQLPQDKAPSAFPGQAAPADPREALLQAAIQLFARHGFEGTTVRDIAALAGTNICMISYHFEGKQGLYRACLERYGQARLEMAREMLAPAASREELKVKLRLITQGIIRSCVENPELTRMVHREIEAGLPVAPEVYETTFIHVFDRMVQFFRSAQKSGLVRAELDPQYLVLVIYGTIGQFFRYDAANRKYFNRSIHQPRDQEKLLETLLGALFGGIIVEAELAQARGQ